MKYAGIDSKYGVGTVCATKRAFNTYTAGHKFIKRKNITNQGPYPCRFKLSNQPHFHLSSAEEVLGVYHMWLQTGCRDVEVYRNKRTITETQKINKALRALTLKLNGNLTHQDIMDEIELGWKITGIRVSRLNIGYGSK